MLYFHYKLALNLVFKDLKTIHVYKHLKSTYNSLKRRINTLERKGLKIDLDQQQQILNLYKLYSKTNKSIIKTNIKNHINKQNLKPATISNNTGIPKQTIYAITKQNSNYKPDFITALTICNYLKISITDLLQSIPGLCIADHQQKINTKWTITAKQEFINDYNRLSITEVCSKYNITPRTAQEYNKNFKNDLKPYNSK